MTMTVFLGLVMCSVGGAAMGEGLRRMHQMEPGIMLWLQAGTLVTIMGLVVLAGGGLSAVSDIGEMVVEMIPVLKLEES